MELIRNKNGAQPKVQNKKDGKGISYVELARMEQDTLDLRFAAAAADAQAQALQNHLHLLEQEYSTQSVAEFNAAKEQVLKQIAQLQSHAQSFVNEYQKRSAELQQLNNAYFESRYSHFINPNAKPQQGQKGFVPYDQLRLNEKGVEHFANFDFSTETFQFKGVEMKGGKHYLLAAIRVPVDYAMPVLPAQHLSVFAGQANIGLNYAMDTLDLNRFIRIKPSELKIAGGCEIHRYKDNIRLYYYGSKAHPQKQGWTISIMDVVETVVKERVPSYLLLWELEVMGVIKDFAPQTQEYHNQETIAPFTIAPDAYITDTTPEVKSTFKDYTLYCQRYANGGAITYTMRNKNGEKIFANCCYATAQSMIKFMFEGMTPDVQPTGFDPRTIGFTQEQNPEFPSAQKVFSKHGGFDYDYLLLFHPQNTAEFLAGWTLLEKDNAGVYAILEQELPDIIDTAAAVETAIQQAASQPVPTQTPPDTTPDHTLNWVYYLLIGAASVLLLALLVSKIQ